MKLLRALMWAFYAAAAVLEVSAIFNLAITSDWHLSSRMNLFGIGFWMLGLCMLGVRLILEGVDG